MISIAVAIMVLTMIATVQHQQDLAAILSDSAEEKATLVVGRLSEFVSDRNLKY